MAGLLAIKPRVINVAALAEEALWQELELTPKPGLVDKSNNGSHRDMDHALFVRSIQAISPWFSRFEEAGRAFSRRAKSEQLSLLRPMGIACEQAMLRATHGVNTHKGGVFALGLLCFAAGRLAENGEQINALSLSSQVSGLCQGMVQRELASRTSMATAGERQFHQFGLTGARGEAESGFATVMRYVLPYWNPRAMHEMLLRLMAVNPDSNLVSRGGIVGLRDVQMYAQQLLSRGWEYDDLVRMDKQLIERNLSPGGSADLLSVAWVLGECKHYPLPSKGRG
ncbi:triphosphoribosyl-dephospho-CoA synthase CitG [Pseudocitrobacter sp. 73]|uniref:triphosphoribosyl-dephospho-CoA synthase CitG n=1 Tax=Pseudocitrobacter sp. 73 TaxID=2605731 RepID=UPI0011ED0C4F|nr:triphosphoribosyl-dephospho-CoA synthase CitG [Pseudocitrobacter sp. 73]KAA1049040.1 triphosphoribosyl-dephospho-CoA synthase CitG [Pseudocitrobacter sp. 73]